MKNVAVLFNAPGNQPEEVIYPYYRLLEANFHVEVVGVGEVTQHKDRKVILGKYGIPTPYSNSTHCLSFAYIQQAKVIIVPGGWECPELLRQDQTVLRYIAECHAKNTVIAAICHGPWVLISAGIMTGRRATCYKGMRDDLINAGCEYIDENVVVDGNIITAPHYCNNPDFMKAVLCCISTTPS